MMLSNVQMLSCLDKCEFPCAHSDHRCVIEIFTQNIVNALQSSASQCDQSRQKANRKPFWSPELSRLKCQSVEAHKAWVSSGRPRTGVVNDNRLVCKSRYKAGIRRARKEFGKQLSDKMTTKLLSGDSKSFWTLWNSHFHHSSVNSTCISGIANDDDIVQGFMQTFSHNCFESGNNVLLKERFMSLYDEYVTDSSHSEFIEFTVNDVDKAILDLKKGKAADAATLTAEHVIYADHVLSELLCCLFNVCCKHGFVPDQFALSLVVPVIKDKSVKTDVFDNYRPISLVHIFSKVFELCIAQRMYSYFEPDELQYGFVNGRGCQKALFTLQNVVDYYTTRGSPIYMAALDASKAFDRVNHYGLFCKLMKLGLPLYLLNVVINWHLKLKGQVRWNGRLSGIFNIRSGIRQGGINSTWFFNVYIFELIGRLRESGFGCYIISVYIGCLFFADDIILLSASILHLQSMLCICSDFGIEFDVKFNPNKSHLLQIGLDTAVKLPELLFCNVCMKWSVQIRYLGVFINAGKKFSISTDVSRRKFLGSVYAILQKCKHMSEEIKCHIIQHSCLPILTYGVDSLRLSKQKLHELSVSYNTAIRRCFYLSRFTSVRPILFYTGSLPFNMLMDERYILLVKECMNITSTSVLRLCGLLAYNEVDFVQYKVDISLTKYAIKEALHNAFYNDVVLQLG
jgi:Reverse transcriptase (RNA-dependent DNA polymerase)